MFLLKREQTYSKNVRFRLSSSLLSNTIASTNFLGVYNDQPWNLSVRLRPDVFGLTGSVAGVLVDQITYLSSLAITTY